MVEDQGAEVVCATWGSPWAAATISLTNGPALLERTPEGSGNLGETTPVGLASIIDAGVLASSLELLTPERRGGQWSCLSIASGSPNVTPAGGGPASLDPAAGAASEAGRGGQGPPPAPRHRPGPSPVGLEDGALDPAPGGSHHQPQAHEAAVAGRGAAPAAVVQAQADPATGRRPAAAGRAAEPRVGHRLPVRRDR